MRGPTGTPCFSDAVELWDPGLEVIVGLLEDLEATEPPLIALK
jgi:hypothetical protein